MPGRRGYQGARLKAAFAQHLTEGRNAHCRAVHGAGGRDRLMKVVGTEIPQTGLRCWRGFFHALSLGGGGRREGVWGWVGGRARGPPPQDPIALAELPPRRRALPPLPRPHKPTASSLAPSLPSSPHSAPLAPPLPIPAETDLRRLPPPPARPRPASLSCWCSGAGPGQKELSPERTPILFREVTQKRG